MDEHLTQLEQLLQDPGAMERIRTMASAMGLADGQSQPLSAGPGTQDRKQDALFRALLPYLQPGRQARLERALKIARLTSLAGFALQAGEQEADHV